MYKFEHKKKLGEALQETDSEDEDVDETASFSTSTESATVHDEASDSLNETHEEDLIIETPIFSAVDRVTECPDPIMVSYPYCEVIFRKGGIKRHQVYCKKRPALQ